VIFIKDVALSDHFC